MVFRAGDRLTNRPYEIKKEVGMDYTRLRDLLEAGEWEKANTETGQVILRAANREEEGDLRYEDLEKLNNLSFRTIDQLWVQYSSGHFGFSVQKRIWEKLGGTKEWDYGIAKKLGVNIGWRQEESWIDHKDLLFDINALYGHLPMVCIFFRNSNNVTNYSELV